MSGVNVDKFCCQWISLSFAPIGIIDLVLCEQSVCCTRAVRPRIHFSSGVLRALLPYSVGPTLIVLNNTTIHTKLPRASRVERSKLNEKFHRRQAAALAHRAATCLRIRDQRLSDKSFSTRNSSVHVTSLEVPAIAGALLRTCYDSTRDVSVLT